MERTKTIFIDVDGTVLVHQGTASGAANAQFTKDLVLRGVKNQFDEWSSKGYVIIITTARKESTRQQTEAQLRLAGLFWDQLIMGLGQGERILVNDWEPTKCTPTATAVHVVRDSGLDHFERLCNQARIRAQCDCPKCTI